MRWISKKPYLYQERIITKHLILPLKINNEWRWLEKVMIRQWYTTVKWQNKEWLEVKKHV